MPLRNREAFFDVPGSTSESDGSDGSNTCSGSNTQVVEADENGEVVTWELESDTLPSVRETF